VNVLHFFLGKANPDRANGVNQVINGYGKYLSKNGVSVKMVGLSKLENKKSDTIQRDGFEVEVYDNFFGGCFQRLKELSKEVDIVHLHSVWNHYNMIFAYFLQKNNIPYIITAHAGLIESRLKQSNYFVKLIYHRLFQKSFFDKAIGIHAITKEEMTEISNYTDNKNIFYVPNGLDIEKLSLNVKEYSPDNDEIKFGYLGRFGYEKNIDTLIDAIQMLPSEYKSKIKCYLIGPIDKDALVLKEKIRTLNLNQNIIFTDAIYGDEKYNFLENLDFYIHPALSDVVSIALMEAFSCGLPAVVSRASHVSYFIKSDAFIMVEPIASDIKDGIMEIIDKKNMWKIMSQNAISLVKEEFNWDVNSKKIITYYHQITSEKLKI
jgi:glycosyltransferase involved in cell wall biosynthesis